MKYGVLVIGPAGAGKSTFCTAMQSHGEIIRRPIEIVNLDPGAEVFDYNCSADVRELIHIDDVMEDEDLQWGPNGSLVFCMEYLMKEDGREWLEEALGECGDFIFFDCPGQTELYTHMDVMKQLVDALQAMQFNMCVIYVIDSHFMIDISKFIFASMTSLTVMCKLELPQLNLISKVDLLRPQQRKNMENFLNPVDVRDTASNHTLSAFDIKYQKLTLKLAEILEDKSLVSYIPFNMEDEESVSDVFVQLDMIFQYSDEDDVKTKDFEDQGQEED